MLMPCVLDDRLQRRRTSRRRRNLTTQLSCFRTMKVLEKRKARNQYSRIDTGPLA